MWGRGRKGIHQPKILLHPKSFLNESKKTDVRFYFFLGGGVGAGEGGFFFAETAEMDQLY